MRLNTPFRETTTMNGHNQNTLSAQQQTSNLASNLVDLAKPFGTARLHFAQGLAHGHLTALIRVTHHEDATFSVICEANGTPVPRSHLDLAGAVDRVRQHIRELTEAGYVIGEIVG